jgi:hypothetical protein
MSTLNESILSVAEALPEGGLLSPKEFLHLASRAAVDQTFSRLAREGHLHGQRTCSLEALRVVSITQ